MDYELTVIPALMIVGKIMKNIPRIPDYIIPITLMIISISFCIFLYPSRMQGIIQGILFAGTATGLHQISKQITK